MNLLIVYLIKWQKTVENLRTSSQTLFIFRLLDASVYFDIFTFLMYKFVYLFVCMLIYHFAIVLSLLMKYYCQ